MAPQPPRREQRRTHLDASVVPVERALLARATALTADLAGLDVMAVLPAATELKLMLALEFRALAEELHWH